MKNKLFIFLLLNVFLMSNTPIMSNLTNAILVNGNGEGSSLTSQISIVVDVNKTNIAQFKHPTSSSSTTITKGGSNHDDILLEKITYNSKNPIQAKIRGTKLIFVFNLVDDSKTTTAGNIVIKSDVLRDGGIGGAFNIDILTITAIDDKANPILLSARTIDGDSDGYIDKIHLLFTEDIKTSNTKNNGFSVSSNTVLGISSSLLTENNSSYFSQSQGVYIRLKENTFFDTGATPSVAYSEKSSNKLQDGNDNNITTISSFSVQDKAKPILLSVSARSVHDGADIINVGFSEPIFKPLNVLDNAGDITSGGSPSLDGALVKYDNGDRNISMELNESKYQGYIQNLDITVNMQTSAKDKNGNYFNVQSKSTTVVLETIKPKLLSVSKLGDKKDFIISFDEAMQSFDYHTNYMTISTKGVSAVSTGGNIAIDEVIWNQNKKTAIVKVNDLPVFTEAETRTIIFSMTDRVMDLAGNSIDANESNISIDIAKDSTPPIAKDFTINMDTKKITIDFNESVALNTFNPEAILITRYNEGNISLTSHSKATYSREGFSLNTGKIIISLNDDINSLKSFLKDKEDFNISIKSSSGIIDFAGNAANNKNIPLSPLSGSFVSDSASPKLLSWDYDLDNKKITLNFDEPMKVVNYNANDISISDSNITFTNKLMFDQNKSSAKAIGKNIEITLFSSQIITILNDDLAKDRNHTFLEIATNSSFKDIKENSAQVLNNTSALRTKLYNVDKNNISKLNLISNTWNHITIDRPTKIDDIMASGKISHIYTYSNEVWYPSPAIIDPKVGYWIKASDHSSILEIPSNSKTYIKGSKEADLYRIESQTAKTFHLIGIENNLTYEEMHSSKNSICKHMRIHHYDSSNDLSLAGWDKNSSVLENSSLWVLCVQ